MYRDEPWLSCNRMDHAKKSLKVQVEKNNVFLKGHAYLTASMTLVRGLLRKRERERVCVCVWEREAHLCKLLKEREREREGERTVCMCVIGREKEWEIYRDWVSECVCVCERER